MVYTLVPMGLYIRALEYIGVLKSYTLVLPGARRYTGLTPHPLASYYWHRRQPDTSAGTLMGT